MPPHRSPVKTQRLDYTRFAEVLSERGLVEHATLQHILQQSFSNGELFPEVLVRENLVTDWELSRVACEAFQVVFLSVDVIRPSTDAVERCDAAFLHQQCLVPIGVFGDVMTVCMPALTPSDVLNTMGEKLGMQVMPFVGTAASNRRWLEENMKETRPVEAVGGALPAATDAVDLEGDWGSVFDEGDAAVLMDLKSEDGEVDLDAALAPDDAPQKDVPDLSGLDDLDDLLS